MVVHPSPGHYTGTLVNAVLRHYSLPAISLEEHAARLQGSSNASDLSSRPPEAAQHSTVPAREPGHDGAAGDGDDDDDDLLVTSLEPTLNAGDGSDSVGEAVGSGEWREGHHGAEHSADSAAADSSADSAAALPQNGDAAVLRPGIVHRLDKGTTGLMVVCRTPVALLRLGEQVKARSVRERPSSMQLGLFSSFFFS